MLPSKSTLAREPSLFPPCGVGTATPCGQPVSPAGDDVCGAADFGILIADLEPVETPSEPITPDLGACCLPVPGLAVAPPPVSLGPLPDVTASALNAPGGASEASDQPDEVNPFWAGPTSARLEWMGLDGTTGATAGVRGEGTGQVLGMPVEPRTDAPPDSSRPAATASDRAMQTPRYAGLPAALEHRPSATLPPGIARLQTLPAELASPPASPDVVATIVPPADVTAVVPPDAGRLRFAESPGSPSGSQVLFRGAVLTKADHPGEAAQATLERNGFSADETIHLRAERALSPEEKNAGRRDAAAPAFGESDGAGKKSFLGYEGERLGKRDRNLGTDSAKPANAMPATSLHAPLTHPNSHYAVTPVAAAGPLQPDARPVAETADTFSTAHEAVEVVLHAVEHVAAREQKSVQLKFAVAGEELAVRVEMRADEVRTTFRTDSAELRTALAHEWQQVAGTSTVTDRSIRLSPAVFAAAGQSANAFAGDTSSRDRRAGTPRDEFERPLAALRGRTVAAAAHDLTPPVTAAPSRSGGAHRLHTLA